MALEVGTNSYVSVADADAYFADRLYADAWTAAGEAKAAALVTATQAVDRLPYRGVKLDETQVLAFPRIINWQSEASVPQEVIWAVCEEALARLERGNSTRLQAQRQGVTSRSIGAISETYATGQTGRAASVPRLLSDEAAQLLAPYRLRVVALR